MDWCVDTEDSYRKCLVNCGCIGLEPAETELGPPFGLLERIKIGRRLVCRGVFVRSRAVRLVRRIGGADTFRPAVAERQSLGFSLQA